jgi:hypothetical protein
MLMMLMMMIMMMMMIVLLNDVFGIQSRAGCMCTGPYAQTSLGIDEKTVNESLAVDNRVHMTFGFDIGNE